MVFTFDDGKAYLYLDKLSQTDEREREPVWHALFQLHFSSPLMSFIKGLKSSNKPSLKAAEKIYKYYLEVLVMFEGILRTVGKTKNLYKGITYSIEEFFEGDSLNENVTWWIGSEEPKSFRPKIPKKRRRFNPLFLKNQIITTNKWKKMQEAINKNEFPSAEMLELLRIRTQAEWGKGKVATLEAAIFAEKILRDYANRVLISLGMSKNKLKNIKDELTFSTILNILLPLSLSKSEAKRLRRHIQAVDILRKIRNDVMHGNITESEIDEVKVRAGIESTLKLVDFIRGRLNESQATGSQKP